ncbi:hypothetical protein NVB75_03665 [Pseudomonas sp. CBS]|uniref:hypothetical protein n=1 Tax=Pseudomonas TaxID=286 RepID=UPI0021AC7F68|nr:MULTISPECIES: hypothetical protein [unclassified Pseudomonas]UVH51965.1 hypothetical protein NVB75_03665 [Pseudomonas sp. CBS]WEL64475.1 hypothetical protein P0D93_30970 [Pseudomonas sp. CBSPGW29]WEL74970.1 hypothetical protein P0D92_22925 [Pseudomonas sp. CBSPAW29]WEL89305.1 hypothetical protein P0D90_05195 [Pseudomonas sp. CBSPCBW29]
MSKPALPNDLLPPVTIYGLQPPIEGDVEKADGGIGLRHLEHSLVVWVARPENSPVGTLFELYWGTSFWPVASNFIRHGDEWLSHIPLIVPAYSVGEYWADPVYAVVVRNGTERKTQPLRLRINRHRPGGRDPDIDAPGHQNLVFELAPDVLLDGVNDERALRGVEVTFRYWENMAAYDLIIFVWGSQRIERRVQPHEVKTDIRMTVDYPTIADAGNGEAIPVAFQVMGPTGNYPDEWAPWSATSWVDVHLNIQRLEAPWVTFPVTDRDIDLAQLDGRPVRIGVRISAADARTHSLVTLVWAGRDGAGAAVPGIQSKALSGAGSYEFTIDHGLIAANAKGRAVVYYLLQGAGQDDKPSYNRHLRVIGEVSRWLPPTIDQQTGDFLLPDLANATVRFPTRASWSGGGQVEVVWITCHSDDAIEYRTDPQAPPAAGHMTFSVPGTQLTRFDGYLVEVYYVFTRPGELPQESERLTVQVGEPVRDMDAPTIENAFNGQLSPDDIGDYIKVTAPFTDTERADWITLFWMGPLASTSVKVQVGLDGQFTEHLIARDFVMPNLDQRVRAFFSLERSGQKTRFSHVTLVQIFRGLGELPAPKLLGAAITRSDSATLAPLDVQEGTQLVVRYVGMRASDTVQVTMKGTAGAGSPVIPSRPGNDTGGVLEFDIHRAAIAANIGNSDKLVTFAYSVTRAGETRASQPLTVAVTPIPTNRLPIPLINRLPTGSALVVPDFNQATRWSIGAYPFQTPNGQRIWLTYVGTNNSNREVIHEPWSGALNGHAAGYEYDPRHTWFSSLKQGSVLRVEVRIGFDKTSTDKAQAVLFPVATYVVNSKFVDLTTFNDYQMNGWRTLDENHPGGIVAHSGRTVYRSEVNPASPVTTFLFKDYFALAAGSYRLMVNYSGDASGEAKGKASFFINDLNIINHQIFHPVWTNGSVGSISISGSPTRVAIEITPINPSFALLIDDIKLEKT